MARIALYWPSVQDYVIAGAEELAARGHEVSLVIVGSSVSGHHNGVFFVGSDNWDSKAYAADLELFCGWHLPAITKYLRVRSAVRAVRLLYFDTQWRATPRQLLRLPVARLRLTRTFDGCFVPGARQVEFAERLGFTHDRIMTGALTFHSTLFGTVPLINAGNINQRRQFVFAGRAVPEKGYDVVLSGYEEYRAEASQPWRLVIAGNATPRSGGHENYVGFVDHEQLARIMARSSCLVLPSRYEPYGAVVLEAAAAGLHLLVTDEVGARADLLHVGVNGFEIDPVDSHGVAQAMHRISSLTTSAMTAGSRASRQSAAAFTPTAWANSMEWALRWRG